MICASELSAIESVISKLEAVREERLKDEARHKDKNA